MERSLVSLYGSQTGGAKHIRMRKVLGKASLHKCVCCSENCGHHPSKKIEWSQVQGTDGNNPRTDFLPLCATCHRKYDKIGLAVAESNRRRTGEKRQYTIRNPEAYRAAQSARSLKRWGGEQ